MNYQTFAMASPPPSQPRPAGILSKAKRRMLLVGGTSLGLVLFFSNINILKILGIGVILISSVVVIWKGRPQSKAMGETGRLLRRQGVAMWVSRVCVLLWVVWVGVYSYLYYIIGLLVLFPDSCDTTKDDFISFTGCSELETFLLVGLSIIYLIPIFIIRW